MTCYVDGSPAVVVKCWHALNYLKGLISTQIPESHPQNFWFSRLGHRQKKKKQKRCLTRPPALLRLLVPGLPTETPCSVAQWVTLAYWEGAATLSQYQDLKPNPASSRMTLGKLLNLSLLPSLSL